MEFLIILLIICLFIIVVISVNLSISNKCRDSLVKQLARVELDGVFLKAENKSLRHQLSLIETDFSRYHSDQDVIAAVKYAMLRSHPDNGGRTEDFIKFRMIYEKLK